MEVRERDICEILGYWITEYRVFKCGRVTDAYFHVRNSEGEVLSKRFGTIDEPVKILKKIEQSLNC